MSSRRTPPPSPAAVDPHMDSNTGKRSTRENDPVTAYYIATVWFSDLEGEGETTRRLILRLQAV